MRLSSRGLAKPRTVPSGYELGRHQALPLHSARPSHTSSSSLVLTKRLLHRRNFSSSSAPRSEDDGVVEQTPQPAEEELKPKRRTRTVSNAAGKEPSDGAESLTEHIKTNGQTRNVLWQLNDDSTAPGLSADTALPEPWLLQDAYETLCIALQPQTQHRATYPSSSSGLVEPTIGLYCPIEGGDHTIDATVRSIAKRANADVVVVDAVELSGAEHGLYGRAASIFNFADNPLQVASSSSSSRSSRPVAQRDGEEDEEDDSAHIVAVAQPALTIQLPGGLAPSSIRSPRGSASILPMARGGSPPLHRVKAFFDELLALKEEPKDASGKSDSDSHKRPRIVYVRNFPHIASNGAHWFPGLAAAVRSRRQGPMSRPTSPVSAPTVIILGCSAPLQERSLPPSPPPPSGLLGLLAGNRMGPPRTVRSPTGSSWAELDHKSRERRLKERLRRWQRSADAILDDMPKFSVYNTPSTNGRRTSSSSSPSIPDFPFMMGANIITIPVQRGFGGSSEGPSDGPIQSSTEGYFRAIGIVPRERDENLEQFTRMSRRIRFNELALKLAVAEAGGFLQDRLVVERNAPDDSLSVTKRDGTNAAPSSLSIVLKAEGRAIDESLDAWTQSFISWREIKAIADAAVGAALSQLGQKWAENSSSIEPVPVVWDQIIRSMGSSLESKSLRDAWIYNAISGGDASDASEAGKTSEAFPAPDVDEVIESVKKDPELDQHEQRLLPCIVDPASLPTTFKSVHLPESTIDSVRTMVSLPLLFPEAFATGILKSHGMAGALLFGPPGTGKTLLARAIARESGARMLIIKPSDVMDMYVGEGEKLVRSVFSLARRLSPCVVFLDEIDALFGARSSSRESGGAMAHRGIITEFMQEMDGLKSTRDTNVIVIGATNRPFDLDDAVLRRLPRRLLVDLPGPKEREEILKILLRDESLDDDVDLAELAKKTEAFSGSDLKHMCVAAALDAVKETVDVPWAVPSKATTLVGNSAGGSVNSSSDSTAPQILKERSPTADKFITESRASSTEKDSTVEDARKYTRALALRHFSKALHEITPSASESMGTLSAIRKWNQEFGEGAKGKPKRAWGDKFGFNRAVTPPPPSESVNANP